jgi:pimeloyl-ACP methyl ester carboxylesterase
VRGEFIDLSGERLYYYAAGTRGSGEPIVLIHGFPTSSHLWLDVVAKLPPGHRVIVIDLLGFGRSDAPPAADYTIAGHAKRLLRLLDTLRIEKACLVGHGVGGAIARWAAGNAPDRAPRVGVIGAPRNNLLWRRMPIWSAIRSVLLRMPTGVWMPLARMAVARGYVDTERGYRSAELYLMPFAEGDGATILRRHLAHLGKAEVKNSSGPEAKPPSRVVATMRPIRVIESRPGPSSFEPEEAPSEVAATIAQLLATR